MALRPRSSKKVSGGGFSKYSNKKTKVDGIVFHSKKEAKRYCELKLLQGAGVITNLQLQPRFPFTVIIKGIGFDTITEKVTYVSDFFYYENKVPTVEDVKGCRTAVYKKKRKWFLALYPQYRFIES